MITKPTVLILGAGASQPFGFPTGRQLKDKICNNLESWVELFLYSGIDLNLIKPFKQRLSHPGVASVDAFLEHQPGFLQIGKLAIARMLIPFELESNLLNDKPDNWYNYLFNKISCRFEDFECNKLAVVTFNYDRSLEHYLFTAMDKLYGKNPEECASKLKKIPIIHLHGQLSYLPWQSADNVKYRGYGENISERFTFREGSEQIKIVSENISNDPEFAKAHELIEKAEVVYFLGFGYNNDNLKRLSIKKKSNQTIFGSSYGLGDAEIKEIEAKWGYLKLDHSKYDVLGFLRNYGPLI